MKKNKNNEDKIPNWFWGMAILILVLWVIYPFGLNYLDFKDENSKGTFGDSYGTLNTLFSGFAFLGVVYAILLQRKELQLQRHELEMTREELKGSKEAQQDMHKTQEIQRFENTFFNMLDLYSTIVEEIIFKIEKSNGVFKGRDAINRHMTEIATMLKLCISSNSESDKHLEFAISFYKNFYKDNSPIFSHYFRNLYRIFVVIKESGLSESEQLKYAKIVRAQLSNDELLLLFFNSLDRDDKGKKFREYIEGYSLFNNIDLSFIPDEQDREKLKKGYSWQAYGLSEE